MRLQRGSTSLQTTLEHPRRCLLPREVGYAARELVEIQPCLGANRRFQQGTDLADLLLQLAQQLRRSTLGTDHVPEDRPLRPSGDQRLGQAVDVDERAPSASAVLFYRYECHDGIRSHVLTEAEGDDTVRYNLHLVENSILQTLITSPGASGESPRRPDCHRLSDDAIRTFLLT